MTQRASQIANVVSGVLNGPDRLVEGVTFDSRTLWPGELFVPLKGVRDGHDFVDHAVAAGAAAFFSARSDIIRTADSTSIIVDNAEAAFRSLAVAMRRDVNPHVVAITGSVGKTTTKEFVASALGRKYKTRKSPGNANNEVGVPFTLANLKAGDEAVVLEMGMRGRGQIAELCDMARPDVGVITYVSESHLELLGTIESVALAKRELIESLPAQGTAVINCEQEWYESFVKSTQAGVLSFGVHAGDVCARRITLDDALHPQFDLVTPHGVVPVRLQTFGKHMVHNAVAAAAACLALDVPLESIVSGLEATQHVNGRMRVVTIGGGATVLDDCYNASPTSTKAAIDALCAVPGKTRRIAVLGLMAELGEREREFHVEVARYANARGVDVLAYETDMYSTPSRDRAWVLDRLGDLGVGDCLLVKGSRMAGMETLIQKLEKRENQ